MSAGEGMNCPLCTRSLREERQAGVAIDRCAGCGAVYFDAGELSATLGAARSTEKSVELAPSVPGEAPLPCPRDGKAMREVQVTTPRGGEITGPGFVVQVCPHCKGVLLSRRALEASQAHGIVGAHVPSSNPDTGRPERLLGIAEKLLDLAYIWAI